VIGFHNPVQVKEVRMEQQPSVWRIALGTMVGNIGCLIANVLLACMLFAVLTVMGGSLGSLLRNLPGGFR
jgi:hypothetical protein